MKIPLLPYTLLLIIAFLAFHPLTQAQENQKDSIQKHRTGLIVVQTTPNATVQLEQQKHEFWFGAAIANQVFEGQMSEADAAKYKEVFLQNFNSAVTENALKWQVMEREQGLVNFRTTDAILAWTDAHDIPLRGHNIYWGISKFVQDWVKELDDEQLYQALKTRAGTVGGRYEDRFVEYDLNNEMIHGNYYEDRLGKGITKEMADWVKEKDPKTPFYVNDYDILTGNRLDDFVAHIKDLLSQNVPIEGIGVQGHLHAEDFDREALRNSLDVLAQFGLPIVITEFNIPGQRSAYMDDRDLQATPEYLQQQAQGLTDYYRICFANPAVKGILQWGFWEGANWIPASAMYARDWTPKPAAIAYQNLIHKEWRTTFTGQADNNGYCIIPAFYGTHEITTNGQTKTITHKKSNGTTTIKFPQN